MILVKFSVSRTKWNQLVRYIHSAVLQANPCRHEGWRELEQKDLTRAEVSEEITPPKAGPTWVIIYPEARAVLLGGRAGTPAVTRHL